MDVRVTALAHDRRREVAKHLAAANRNQDERKIIKDAFTREVIADAYASHNFTLSRRVLYDQLSTIKNAYEGRVLRRTVSSKNRNNELLVQLPGLEETNVWVTLDEAHQHALAIVVDQLVDGSTDPSKYGVCNAHIYYAVSFDPLPMIAFSNSVSQGERPHRCM